MGEKFEGKQQKQRLWSALTAPPPNAEAFVASSNSQTGAYEPADFSG